MFESIPYLWQYILQTIGFFAMCAFVAYLSFLIFRKLHSRRVTAMFVGVLSVVSVAFFVVNGLPNVLAYPFFLKTYGPAEGPILPLKNVWAFVTHFDSFEKVANIARNPTSLPAPLNRLKPENVVIEMTAKEVISEMAPGVTFNYWTFDGAIPGPFLRVREGDTVTLTLHNDATSLHHHSIDLHAVTGPGGGAAATNVAPGESKTITFKALNPGMYVYHCAVPNVASHMAHGMYGLILVEPKEGLSPVDHEFYVMQGEFYSAGALGRTGLQLFDAEAMLDGKPQYVVFNGRTGALAESMNAKVGETVRIYVGNGGVNLISSFHVIGEIFDNVFREGDLVSPPAPSVQTTLVPAGGASVVEFRVDYPGNYVLVDHALSRLDRGAWGVLHVTGEADPVIFTGEIQKAGGH